MNVEDIRHADYPHTPGSLYDCPRCEAECFCKREHGSLEWTECVFCASLSPAGE